MADLDFFFDPVCPFAWITSRWVNEVKALRDYDVRWRFISLAVLNENQTAEWYTPEYRAGHVAGLMGLRVADAVRLTADNDAVGRIYTELGTALHVQNRRKEIQADTLGFIKGALAAADCDVSLAGEMDNTEHDAHIRAETELALARTGKDVGTPILTFHPDAPDENSFFGPVISKAPRGEAALKLWDAIEVIALTPSMSELKRSSRARLDFT
ncbi:MAG TPA: DsbA family protein [Ilumatobacteraceae bacterium]